MFGSVISHVFMYHIQLQSKRAGVNLMPEGPNQSSGLKGTDPQEVACKLFNCGIE